jgi:hypothetical protein
MLRLLDRLREVDQIDENDKESSPLSRAVDKAVEKAIEIAAEVANDDQETIANPPSSGWRF